MIEIEKRVLLSKTQYTHLIDFFTRKAVQIEAFNRFTMVHVGNEDFTPRINGRIDVRVRTTGGQGTLTVKEGNWHASAARNEYEVHFKTDEIKELMHILLLQEHCYFIITYIHRDRFSYKGLDITLDHYYSMDAHMLEVEIAVEKENEVIDAEDIISSFLKENNLIALTSHDMIEFITSINNVLEMRVDFTKISIEEWYATWKEYIYCRK